MKTKRLCPWFGADEAVGKTIGQKLAGCRWVGVGFAGGMGVLKFIKCCGGVANDKHRHIINLARVVRDAKTKERLIEKLENALFHPDELEGAQKYCRSIEAEIESSVSLFQEGGTTFNLSAPLVEWAYQYFLTQWLGRSGLAGTEGEFNGKLSTRWNANGGGSNVRFRSAAALEGFHEIFRAWEFECMDVFDFIDRMRKVDANPKTKAGENGGYFDAPWPEEGDGYKHKFTEAMQRRLAARLGEFERTRIVIRFGDHPLIRELYPAERWDIIEQDSRDQANQAVPELLILNKAGGGE